MKAQRTALTVLSAGAACAATAVACATASAATSPGYSAGGGARLLPVSASWLSPRHGFVLAYPARTAGAKPVLLETSAGGQAWRRLTPPPVPFPADDNLPTLTSRDHTIVVDDGTTLTASGNEGHSWAQVRLAGLPAHPSGTAAEIARPVVSGGRLYAVVTTPVNGTTTRTRVFSGPAGGHELSPVAGLSVQGSITYGDISAIGGLQVDLGANYTTEHYWAAPAGQPLKSAPLPCPATLTASLGGVQDGKPVALCATPPASSAPGTNSKQVSTAPRLGASFSASGKAITSPDGQLFAADSATDMAAATNFNVLVTFNAGQTWKTVLNQPGGAFWTSLSFPGTTTTGYVVASTYNNAGKQVGTLYRTSNGGGTWQPVPLP